MRDVLLRVLDFIRNWLVDAWVILVDASTEISEEVEEQKTVKEPSEDQNSIGRKFDSKKLMKLLLRLIQFLIKITTSSVVAYFVKMILDLWFGS